MLPDLTSADGRAEFERALTRAAEMTESDPVRRAAAMRTLFDADLATAVLTQEDLRRRGAEKFGASAARMFFTPNGLEQSSRAEVAGHRAGRFARAGLSGVLDLCCGIGGDLLAFARAGLTVEAVDLDPATAAVAAANAAVLAPGPTVVTVGRAEETPWQQAESVFCDPARRTGRGRVFDPGAFSPDFDFVTRLLTGHRHAAVKLAPGLDHDLIPAGVEAEWVSAAGAVKEAVVWSAGFGVPGVTRRATLLPTGVELTDADPESHAVGVIGDYVYEPDGAVIRAGLVRQVAALLPGGRRIDEHLAYLAADAAVDTPFARRFRVLDVLPYSVRRLRDELRSRRVGIAEIKKRGVDVDPAVLRRQLDLSGPESITVLLARVGDDRLAILAEPLRS